MRWMIRKDILTEVAIRAVLWTIFSYLDQADPFVRYIHPDEIWMYQYPVLPSYVPVNYLWVLIILTPTMIMVGEYTFTGSITDRSTMLWSITLAYSLNGSVTSFLKVLVGRPRPDFYYRCFPEGKGTDFEECTGVRKSYMDGRKSFPSGHSSFAFCSMVFITLYLARKLKLFDGARRPNSWQLCFCIAPLIVAAAVAISRTCDYHHHYEDVIAGSLLGSLISYLSFRLYFPNTCHEMSQP